MKMWDLAELQLLTSPVATYRLLNLIQLPYFKSRVFYIYKSNKRQKPNSILHKTTICKAHIQKLCK